MKKFDYTPVEGNTLNKLLSYLVTLLLCSYSLRRGNSINARAREFSTAKNREL